MTHRFREQARSHRGCVLAGNPGQTPDGRFSHNRQGLCLQWKSRRQGVATV